MRILTPKSNDKNFVLCDGKTNKLVNIEEVKYTDYIYFCDVINVNWYHMLTQKLQHINILSDVECSFLEYSQSKNLFIPYLRMGMYNWIKLFIDNNVTFSDTNYTTNYCFTFSVNKKTYDRHIFLKLVEWFKFKDFSYLWHGNFRFFDMDYFINNESKNIQDIDNWTELKTFMLLPVELKENFINNSLANNRFVGYYVKTESTLDNWIDAHSKMNPNSAVCVITESSADNILYNNYTFTEKTLYGILGLNFLIWPGNYGQAQKAKEMGFDIFDDVIDHSYQFKRTVFERCYYALERNIEILTNLTVAKRLRTENFDRLLKNRNYCLYGGFVDWIQKELDSSGLSEVININGKYKDV